MQTEQFYITPLEEQQMFDDWCPYKGNPDPRTVWAAAIQAVNGLLLQSPCGNTPYDEGPFTLVQTAPVNMLELFEATRYIADDYMTSQTHHPDWVLIPAKRFYKIVSVLKSEQGLDNATTKD